MLESAISEELVRNVELIAHGSMYRLVVQRPAPMLKKQPAGGIPI
jgi:hypothetical protein